MLAKTLQYLIDEKCTTAREIGELAGVPTSTVYRWINRESQPDFDSIRLLMRHLPNPDAQEALLAVFAAGSNWQFAYAEMDLDVNHDGHINGQDALDACCSAVKASADSLCEIRNGCGEGGELTADETLRVMSLLNQLASHCTLTQRVLMDMAETRRKKKLKLVR